MPILSTKESYFLKDLRDLFGGLFLTIDLNGLISRHHWIGSSFSYIITEDLQARYWSLFFNGSFHFDWSDFETKNCIIHGLDVTYLNDINLLAAHRFGIVVGSLSQYSYPERERELLILFLPRLKIVLDKIQTNKLKPLMDPWPKCSGIGCGFLD